MENKKYFIGCTFEDTFSELLELNIEDFCHKFGLKNPCKKHSVHLTNKVPFIATQEQVSKVQDFLERFVSGVPQIELTMWGFNHFSNHTLYIDIAPNEKLLPYIIFQRRLYDRLYEEFGSWMTFGKYEPLELPHLTIAKDDIDLKLIEILSYINNRDSSFNISNHLLLITDLSIFEKQSDDTWSILKKFSLQQKASH